MRLNKYIAHSGVCSRRAAAELVKGGEIKVNGTTELNPSYMVEEGDNVEYKGKTLKREKNKVYLLLNKPIGYVTTLDDEKGRRTVIDLVKKKVSERVYPVGRLDLNTCGLLLLTNDGDLAHKLSHPSHEVVKVYHAVLNDEISEAELDKIRQGLTLEDGFAKVDEIEFVKNAPKNEVGLKLHMGKNRIVRRLFEHLGYHVNKLDRTYYAGLTKKDLPRGFSRFLNKEEIIRLKHLS
ncbi:MAG: pseudouridine synthase [Saprospiraceae bacterium]|nr:pseudouridine synthase [Saprospiraceae bacterium]